MTRDPKNRPRGQSRHATAARKEPVPVEAPRAPRGLREALRTDRGRALALCFVAFLVYNANFRLVSAGDCFPARFLPFALWARGSLTLDSVRDVARVGFADPSGIPYWMMLSPRGEFVSSYPLVTPVLVAPIYAPAAAILHALGWKRGQLAAAAALMEKLAASLVAAVTVGLMYLLLRRRLGRSPATLLSLAFAFGCSTWVTSSQALWQHGTTQLLAVVALLALTSELTPVRLAVAGAACGLIPFNRPPDLPLALAIGAAALLAARGKIRPFVAAAVVAAVPFATLNWVFHGHLGGGYFRFEKIDQFFRGSIPVGLAGLLVSPGKGLFVFSPFLLFLIRRLFRPAPGDGFGKLDACLAGGVVVTLLLLSRGDFRGGFSYGPRFLTGILPALFWLLAPVLREATVATRRLIAAGALAGAAMQAVGAFCYPHGLSDLKDVWSFRDAPFIVEARAGVACPTLLEPLVDCRRP